MKVTDTKSFIHKARAIHGSKYDYRFSVYTGARKFLKIFCLTHDKTFEQKAMVHLLGYGCPTCAKEKLTEK
ncbi:hypothetical protein ABXV21_26950, partial [Vibrio harveyi]